MSDALPSPGAPAGNGNKINSGLIFARANQRTLGLLNRTLLLLTARVIPWWHSHLLNQAVACSHARAPVADAASSKRASTAHSWQGNTQPERRSQLAGLDVRAVRVQRAGLPRLAAGACGQTRPPLWPSASGALAPPRSVRIPPSCDAGAASAGLRQVPRTLVNAASPPALRSTTTRCEGS